METIVFTNGCFDIIHPGHIDLLKQARSLGTKLIVGINSDRSVREIKGTSRPLLNQESRAAVLRELRSVDEVRIFDENTPERIIKEINPHVLVKGGDWKTDQIIGADFVLENGGRVFSIPFKQNVSTSRIIEKIQTGENADQVQLNDSGRAAITGNFTDHDETFFHLPKVSDVKRGAELIADVLLKDNRIYLAAFSAQRLPAERLAEDFKRYFGDEKVSLLKATETFEKNKDFIEVGDLLVGVGGEKIKEDFAGIIMQARQKGCRILLLTGRNGRKLAALSDVCIMFEADSPEAELWKQETVGYFLFQSINLQKSFS